jgi:hypothetical protein
MALHLSGRAHTLLVVTSQLLIGSRLGYGSFSELVWYYEERLALFNQRNLKVSFTAVKS